MSNAKTSSQKKKKKFLYNTQHGKQDQHRNNTTQDITTSKRLEGTIFSGLTQHSTTRGEGGMKDNTAGNMPAPLDTRELAQQTASREEKIQQQTRAKGAIFGNRKLVSKTLE